MDCDYRHLESRGGERHLLKCSACGHERTGPYPDPSYYHRRCTAPLAAPCPVRSDRQTQTPVLFRFRHGLGDCVQAAVVLRHLRYLRPDLAVDVQCFASMRPLFAGLCRDFYEFEAEPAGPYEIVYNVPWPEHPEICYSDSPSTKAERHLREVHGIQPRPDLWHYRIDVPAAAHQRAAAWLAARFGEPTLAGKLLSFGRAMLSLAVNGKASAEERERRLAICTGGTGPVAPVCDQYEEGRCRACGCAISLKATLAETKCPLGKWETRDGRVKAALIHYRGASFGAQKDLPDAVVSRLCGHLLAAGVTPIVLDHGPLPAPCEIPGVLYLGPRDELWGGECPDPTVLAALAGMVSLWIGIDSGPEHVWASTDTPGILCWTGHHPVHFFAPSTPGVLHLVPAHQWDLLRGNRAAGQDFFRDHYRHLIYTDLAETLCAAVEDLLM